MSESRAAVRYAKATLDLAQDNKALDALEKDMRSIVQTISDSELASFLNGFKQQINTNLAKMPDHHDFVNQYCS